MTGLEAQLLPERIAQLVEHLARERAATNLDWTETVADRPGSISGSAPAAAGSEATESRRLLLRMRV